MLCDVCMRHTSTAHWVPDRAVGVWRFDAMCLPCFDGFLALFPLTPRCFVRRETTGRPPWHRHPRRRS